MKENQVILYLKIGNQWMSGRGVSSLLPPACNNRVPTIGFLPSTLISLNQSLKTTAYKTKIPLIYTLFIYRLIIIYCIYSSTTALTTSYKFFSSLIKLKFISQLFVNNLSFFRSFFLVYHYQATVSIYVRK